MSGPLEFLAAYDRQLLDRIGDWWSNSSTLGWPAIAGRVSTLRCDYLTPSVRKRHQVRAQRLQELSAPKILVDHEEFLANPESFIQQRLLKSPEHGDVEILQFLGTLACKRELMLTDCEVEWFIEPDHHGFSAFTVAEAGLAIEEPIDRTNYDHKTRESARMLYGTSYYRLADSDLFDIRSLVGYPGSQWNWHDAQNIPKVSQYFHALAMREPPPPDEAVYSNRATRELSMGIGAGRGLGELQGKFQDEALLAFHQNLTTSVTRQIGKIKNFYRASRKKGWEVLCPTNY